MRSDPSRHQDSKSSVAPGFQELTGPIDLRIPLMNNQWQ
jgi:hypothetical protein